MGCCGKWKERLEFFLFVSSEFLLSIIFGVILVCAFEGIASLNLWYCYVVFCGYGFKKKMYAQQLDNLTLGYVLLSGSGLFKEQSM